MNIFARIVILIAALGVMSACAPTINKDYTKIRTENLRSVLVLPVVNNTVDVDAPRYFLSTVSAPVAERGYYIFPVNLVRGVMQEEGLSDADMVHSADPTVLGSLFGADAILYIAIEKWETQYLVISASTKVSFDYVLKSGKTGEELWRDTATIIHSTGSGGGGWAGLIAKAIAAAIQKAAPDYMPLARRANRQVIWTPGRGLPAGPYHEEYNKDHGAFASAGDRSRSADKVSK